MCIRDSMSSDQNGSQMTPPDMQQAEGNEQDSEHHIQINGGNIKIVADADGIDSVSYTHLDVYKRQDIRNRVKNGQTVRYMLPENVRDYINKYHLYKENENDR